MAESEEIPEPGALFVKEGLYKHYKLDPQRIRAVELYSDSADMYCVECGKNSVFTPATKPITGGYHTINVPHIPSKEELDEQALRRRIFTVTLHCSRNSEHTAHFIFRVGPDSFCKIGQFPSIADQRYPPLRKYRKLLGPYYRELTKAVGLFAHGIGVGSFVYLRRIFEHLVEEVALERKQEDPSWNIDEWRKKRIDGKIDDLADRLPQFLVENSSIYGVLSKGVHELSEDECLDYFTIVENGIELILDERLAKQEEARKKKLVKDEITRIKGEIT